MSRHVISLAALSLSLALIASAVHAAPPEPAAGLAPPPRPLGPPAGGPAARAMMEGQVQRLLINPYGEVDGLRLADGSIAKFPPHMADALAAAVNAGDTVRVIGRPEGRGTIKADVIVNVASGQTVFDQPPAIDQGRPLPPHLRAQRLEPQQVEGLVDAVLSGPRGEVNGIILADGAIVRFPPDSLRQPVAPGTPFAAAGLGTRNAIGTSLEAVSIGATLSALQPIYAR